MSAVQETHIEGDPEAITALATYLRSTLTPAVSALAQDFATARRNSSDAWGGEAASAFRERLVTAEDATQDFDEEIPTAAAALEELAEALEDAQRDMASALAHATSSGLTVTGTQIHRPVPPQLGATTSADHSERLAAAHANRVAAWDWCVDTAAGAFTLWADALRDFEDQGARISGSMASLFTSLLTDGTKTAALAVKAYNLTLLRNFHLENADNLRAHIAALTPDGVVRTTPQHIYDLEARANASQATAKAIDDKFKAGLRVGSRLSRGLHVVGGAATVYGIYDDIQQGESVEQAVVSNVGGMAAGMITGAGTGALIGTFVVPPVGTVVGAALGTVVGAGVGMFTSGVIDHMWENASADFFSTIDAGWSEVTNTLSDVGGLAKGAWNSLFG